MDQGLDNNKSPSASYSETFRRHRKLFCLPIVLGVVAAALSLFAKGTTYESTASLWVDTAPPLPSSVGANTGSALSEPPAVAAQAILSELLTTRAFAASVAKTSLPGKSLSSADAEKLLQNGPVVGTTPGSQVLQISYTASSAAVAEHVLGAVITQLHKYTDRLAAQHDQATVAYDREAVKAAETALAAARRNVAAYQGQHPGVTPADPNYAPLITAQSNAATQLAQANTALSQDGNAQGWLIQVTDPPNQASTTPLRKSKVAEVLFAGALGGLLVSFLAVVALTPGKKEVWEDELPFGEPLFPDVRPADLLRAESPEVSTAAAGSTPPANPGGKPRLSLGDLGFQFRTRSVPTEKQ